MGWKKWRFLCLFVIVVHWNASFAFSEVSCPLIQRPLLNGWIEYSPEERTVYASAFFFCDDGFDLLPDKEVIEAMCEPSGTWVMEEVDMPVCVARTPVPSVKNGGLFDYHPSDHRISPGEKLKHGRAIILKCDSGFEAFSNCEFPDDNTQHISTSINGTWHPSIAECKPVHKCPEIQRPLYNGMIEYSHRDRRAGSSASFVCNEGSDLFPENKFETMCQLMEIWDMRESDMPTCFGRTLVPSVNHGGVYDYYQSNREILAGETIKHRRHVLVKCSKGFEGFRNGGYIDNTAQYVSMSKNGTWNPSLAECRPRKYSSPATTVINSQPEDSESDEQAVKINDDAVVESTGCVLPEGNTAVADDFEEFQGGDKIPLSKIVNVNCIDSVYVTFDYVKCMENGEFNTTLLDCMAECPKECEENGFSCNEPNICNCPPGRSGEFCDKVDCPESCTNNGGQCETPNDCTCPPERTGDMCEKVRSKKAKYRVNVKIKDELWAGTHEKVKLTVRGKQGTFTRELKDDMDQFNSFNNGKKLRYEWKDEYDVGEIIDINFSLWPVGMDTLRLDYVSLHSFSNDRFYRFSQGFDGQWKISRRCSFETQNNSYFASEDRRIRLFVGRTNSEVECQLVCAENSNCKIAKLDRRNQNPGLCEGSKNVQRVVESHKKMNYETYTPNCN